MVRRFFERIVEVWFVWPMVFLAGMAAVWLALLYGLDQLDTMGFWLCALALVIMCAAFSRGSSHSSLSAYINNLRLDHAYNLLISQPSLDFEQVALRSGFSSRKYFSDRFKLRYGMTLTEFVASRASLGADQSQ